MPGFVWRSLAVASVVVLACFVSAPADENAEAKPRLRRPVAVAVAEDGKRLLVANRDAGTIALLDPRARRLVREFPLAQRISGMAYAPKTSLIAATDEAAGVLIFAECRNDRLGSPVRIRVGPDPVSVVLDDEGRWAVVALLWARQAAVVDRDATVVRLDLPFAPRSLLRLSNGKVLVADAFGDRLAVVDPQRKAVESVRSLAVVHNIRGLAPTANGKGVLLTHQTLHSQGHPTVGDIRAGSMLANNLQRLSLANVVDPLSSLLQNDQTYPLGDIERGAGDPSAVAETPDGRILVPLAGTNELAIGRPDEAIWTRTPVGAGPNALAVDAASGLVYVANIFGDSISIVDWKEAKTVGTLSLGPTLRPAEMTPEQRGEMHFRDARLSLDGWFSCHSCHTDGHSNGKLNDNLSDGTFGTPKRVLSLRGVKDTEPFAWNGKARDIETQVRSSIRSTMQGKEAKDDVVRDLSAYLRSLPPPPGIAAARGSIEKEARRRGEAAFAKLKCASCHAPPIYTSPETYDVGLRDEAGLTHFNPPSLRGVSQAHSWFHDGRARTLREAFERFRHRIPDDLPAEDRNDLLEFLNGL